MRSCYVDTNVLLLAFGREHPQREPARHLLQSVAEGQTLAHTSVETVQEVVHHLMRRRDERAVGRARAVAAMCVLHPFDEQVLMRALDLIEAGVVRGRDAVHAATALQQGLSQFVTVDRHFDAVPGLTCIEPLDWHP